MSALFFLLRLPFFVIGLALYLTVVPLIGGAFLVLWAGWLLFIMPFQFVGKLFGAAFRNDSSVLSDWRDQESAWSDWAETIGSYFTGFANLFDWLVKGG